MAEKKGTLKELCKNHGCEHKVVSECKYCKKNFCKEHKDPRPPGIPNFKATTPQDKDFLVEWRKPGGHACVPYLNYLELKREKANRKYEKHLDGLLRGKARIKSETKDEESIFEKKGSFVWFKKVKCLFGLHDWKKQGGAHHLGHGVFGQRAICRNCQKKEYVKS